MAQRWVSDAELPVGPPRERSFGMGCPSSHDRQHVCRVMEVELVVVDFANRVEGDERGDCEVAGQEEEKLIVCAEGIEEVEGLFLRRFRC